MTRELLHWLSREKSPARADDDEDWILHRPEMSMAIWKMMVATDWRHLPYPGGLLDQPEWLIEDLFTLTWRKGVLKELLKSPLRAPRTAFGD